MLIWHMTGTRSGTPPDIAALILSLGAMAVIISPLLSMIEYLGSKFIPRITSKGD
jgi:hypothetical protein